MIPISKRAMALSTLRLSHNGWISWTVQFRLVSSHGTSSERRHPWLSCSDPDGPAYLCVCMPAITSYSGFPLFLRRPAGEPIANFALDLLLGNPCLVGMHHDYFRQGFEQ